MAVYFITRWCVHSEPRRHFRGTALYPNSLGAINAIITFIFSGYSHSDHHSNCTLNVVRVSAHRSDLSIDVGRTVGTGRHVRRVLPPVHRAVAAEIGTHRTRFCTERNETRIDCRQKQPQSALASTGSGSAENGAQVMVFSVIIMITGTKQS